MSTHNKKTDIILQARMGSTRLPGKVLKKILGKPMLLLQLERLKRTRSISDLIVATTEKSQDDIIEELCRHEGIYCYRGEEEDVLGRYLATAKQFNSDVIVRITGDCPLIDPQIVDQVVDGYFHLKPQADYVSNTLVRTYPRGMDVEVFSKQRLFEISLLTCNLADREHVTRYFYTHPERFHLQNIPSKQNLSRLRLTVDTEDDFLLVKNIFEALYPKNPHFDLVDIVALLKWFPEWEKINLHIQQKET